MSTETANKEKLIVQEWIKADELAIIIAREQATLVMTYHLPTSTFQVNEEQLIIALGYKPEDLSDNFLATTDLWHPDDAGKLHELIQLAATTEGSYYEEPLRRIGSDGSLIKYRVRARHSESSPWVVLHAVHEATASVEMDEISELKRTRAAVIDELQRSNKELEEFAYVASHDLQEPLRKISTFSSRLTERFGSELNDEGRLYLDRIMASAENMRSLIDNLLEFSRISRIRQPFASLNLNFVLHQVLNELELNIEETGTKIRAEQMPVLDASLPQMKQLFCNILSNAIKFRKPDLSPEITITCKRLTQEELSKYNLSRTRVYYCLRFCDNGIGFENEYATRIFQIFQRLHGKSEYPGSGIGLAICKKITDHHRGLIFAENIREQGACFTVILPEKQI